VKIYLPQNATDSEIHCGPSSEKFAEVMLLQVTHAVTESLHFCSYEAFHKADRHFITRSSAIAEGPRDVSCQLESCQLPCNRAETTYTTSPDQIYGMKLEI